MRMMIMTMMVTTMTMISMIMIMIIILMMITMIMIMIMIIILMMIRPPSDPPAPTIHLGESLDPENIAEGDHVYFECRFVIVI